MKKYIHNFIRCGILGWCIEIIFTALLSFRNRQLALKGNTSLWMFPIYGCASFFAPISTLLKEKAFWIRGLIYATLMFGGEFLYGLLLTQKGFCPWDYSRSKWNIKKIIRLDYLPLWFVTGLLFERLLADKDS